MDILDIDGFTQRVYEPIRNRRVYDNTPGYKRYMKSTKDLLECVLKNRLYLTTTKGKFKRTRRAHVSIANKARKVVEAMSYAELAHSTGLNSSHIRLIRDPFTAESLSISVFIHELTLTISTFYNSESDNGFTVTVSNSYLAKKPFKLSIRSAAVPGHTSSDSKSVIRVSYSMSRFPIKILSQTGIAYMHLKRNVGNVESYPLFLESPSIETSVFDADDNEFGNNAYFTRNDIDLHIRNRIGNNEKKVDPNRIAMLRLQYA